MEDDNHHRNICGSTSSSRESSMEEDSINSTLSSSSSSSSCSTDFAEDASSSSSSMAASSHANDGPLYELSDLMAQLPIKRGLSKVYKGKSQSYASLASVKSIEDLAKKVSPYHKITSKIKSCRSFGVLSNSHNISKKTSPRKSFI